MGEQPVYRSLALNISKAHVEAVPLAIGPESLFVQQVRPWRQKGNAAQPCTQVTGRIVENVLPTHLHLICAVAEGWHNRNVHAIRGVRQTNHQDAALGYSFGSVNF